MSTPQAYLTDLQGQVVARLTPSDLVTFGQADSNTVVLDDVSVSPQHGAIVFRGDSFVVERWSRGRIWINTQDNAVEGSHSLQNNDRVLIGKRHVFVFRLGQPEGEAAPAPQMAPTAPISMPSPPGMPPTEVVSAAADPNLTLPPDKVAGIGADADLAAPFALAEPLDVGVDAGTGDAEDVGDADAAAPAGMPAWQEPPAQVASVEVAAEPAPDEPESRAAPETVPDAPPPGDAGATVLEQPGPAGPPAPPVPIPGWVADDDTVRELEDDTPPEGVNVLPDGWQQELQAAPQPPPQVAPAPAAGEGGVWGVRERTEARRLIQDAIQVLRYGDTERARQKLNQALRLNESNEDAWLWLAAVERDPERRRGALQRVLTINPSNPTAQWGLVSLQTLNLVPPAWQQPGAPAGRYGHAPPTQPVARPAPQPEPTIGESIPALLLRPEEPPASPGVAMFARLLSLIGAVMLVAAMFLDYGIWDLDFTLWNDVPERPTEMIWKGLQIWGFAGIIAVAVLLLLILLVRSRHQRWLGMLLAIAGLAIVFMGLFPPIFGIVTDPQIGLVIWGAAGLPLMLAGLLKFW